MTIEISPMTFAEYDEMYALWKSCEGIGLSTVDEREPIRCFLERNPGLSYVAKDQERLVGTALVGFDGRRGYLYHMAVAASHRRLGVGRKLYERCAVGLQAQGVARAHIFVYARNESAIQFWRKLGWFPRPELIIMSKDI